METNVPQESRRFRNVLLYFIFLGLSLRSIFFFIELGLGQWADQAALYNRGSHAAFEKWYVLFSWEWTLHDFFRENLVLFNSLYYLAFCYVMAALVLPAFGPTRALLKNYCLGLFRLAVAAYLVFPAGMLSAYFWGNLGFYTYLWWALLFFIFYLVYLLLEGLALWIRRRWISN